MEAIAPSSPDGQRMRSGAVEQHRHIDFGCRQIAGEQSHWASSFVQYETQGNRMIKCSGLVDSALRGAPGLVRKSLEPEDPRERDARRHQLIKLKPNQRRPLNRRDIATEHALDVMPRIRLISPVMQ